MLYQLPQHFLGTSQSNRGLPIWKSTKVPREESTLCPLNPKAQGGPCGLSGRPPGGARVNPSVRRCRSLTLWPKKGQPYTAELGDPRLRGVGNRDGCEEDRDRLACWGAQGSPLHLLLTPWPLECLLGLCIVKATGMDATTLPESSSGQDQDLRLPKAWRHPKSPWVPVSTRTTSEPGALVRPPTHLPSVSAFAP